MQRERQWSKLNPRRPHLRCRSQLTHRIQRGRQRSEPRNSRRRRVCLNGKFLDLRSVDFDLMIRLRHVPLLLRNLDALLEDVECRIDLALLHHQRRSKPQ